MKLIKDASAEKLRGGFYTPEPIAQFMLQWGLSNTKNLDILEPSCGDGVFLEQLKHSRLPFKSMTGIELNELEAEKARNIGLKKCDVINEDFHHFCISTDKKFDLIVGNPPYIRYQFFNKEQQFEANRIFELAGLKYSKLSNAWVSFVIGSSLLLKKSGKIAFVLPAEILQVGYALQLRKFLAEFYNKINIISFEKLVFPNIQQEVVLLLCEKDNTGDHYIDHLELKDASGLKDLDLATLNNPKKKIDFNSSKWTFYFLDQEEIDFLENIAAKRKIPTIGDFARVEVGITTGANDFFTVPLDTVEKYSLAQYAKPMVGRSVQVNSAVFTMKDWEKNKKSNSKAHLLIFPSKDSFKKNEVALDYIDYGVSIGINQGYKCGIRDEWYRVPSIRVSDGLFIRRNNIYPKLIINQAGAYTTDTMHRVFMNEGVNIKAFTSSYYNSLSLAFAEVSGRSHGGGVLELMPNETERILLPYDERNEDQLSVIDALIREKASIDDILKLTDDVILKSRFGFTAKEIRLANNIWRKLSKRRLNRNK